MRFKVFLLVSLFLLPLFSCADRSAKESLEDIESYIQERPDSALASIRTIDTTRLNTRALRAKYSLLHAMALDKNYIDTTDIAVVMPAVEYYENNGSKENRMKSLFYLGRIQSNSGKYSDAIIAQMKAKVYADELDDTYWRAMLTSALGYTYNQNMCTSGEVKYMEDALTLWKEYGDSSHVTTAMLNLALAYHNNREIEKSDSILTLLKNNGHKYVLVDLAINEMQRSHPDPERAVNLYNDAITNAVPLSIQDYYRYAYALALAGENGKSLSILSQLEDYPDNLKTDYWKYKIEEHRSSYKDAFEHLLAYTTKADSTVRSQLDQSVYRAQSDYYQLNARYSDARRRVANLRLVILGLLSFLTLFIIFVIFRNRHRRIQSRNEELFLMYEESQQMIASIKAQEDLGREQSEAEKKELELKLSSLRSSFAKMYKSQFDSIAQLLESGKDSTSHFDAAKEHYAKRVTTLLADIRKGEKGQIEFERLIDCELDGIMTKLRTDYPNFKDSDFRVLSYLIVGFDATTRSFILGGTANNMRVMKNRLLTYIRNHPTSNEELYKVFLT